MTGISNQKGAPNRKWHVAHAPSMSRALDVLRCPEGADHAVDMESVPVNGVRIGRLVAWCRTCRRPLPASTATPPTPAEVREKRQEARLTQSMRRNDAQARREYIKRALSLGERQCEIAQRLGLTPQRVSQILRGPRRKTA